MFRLRNTNLPVLLFLLFLTSCGVNKYINPGYRNLLMYKETPADVLNHWCEGGFLQFQLFRDAAMNMRDTIVILKFDAEDRFEFYGGISVGEDYERFCVEKE